MRGKVEMEIDQHERDRITPAYAGKSAGNLRTERLCQDHPRLCGEKVKIISPAPTVWGSPPPMRGKVYPATCR